MKNINIRQREIIKKRKKRYVYLPIIIIPFLATFFYLYITEKPLLKHFLTFSFLNNRTEITYDTYDIFFDQQIDSLTIEKISKQLKEINYNEKQRFNIVDNNKKSDISIEYGKDGYVLASQYLLPVGHIYWIKDNVTLSEIVEGKFQIIISNDTKSKYGEYINTIYPNLNIQIEEEIPDFLVNADEQKYIALIQPSELNKDLKLLHVDNKYYLDTFDCGFPIALTINLDLENKDFVSSIILKNVNLSDKDFSSENIAKVNMTGVTAMGRRVALTIDSKKDYDYPAQRIASFLSDADLTHTSNEVSFVEGCSTYSGMRFCSKPEYVETLITSGIDLVELTGNHNNDFGSSNNTKSIELYKSLGIEYFGGGLDDEDAAKPYITEIDGTKIAFFGYNYYDTMLNTAALASSTRAGANSYSREKVEQDIENIEDEVDIVIVDFQFQECYSYPSSDVIFPVCYKPITNQSSTFRHAIDSGADIVIGTQAHQPQTYEIYEDGIIFYGLGNLFFDQTPWIGTRQGMVLTHYFSNGSHIQTKITPTIYDSALQVEIADQEDADLLLELLKTARKSL